MDYSTTFAFADTAALHAGAPLHEAEQCAQPSQRKATSSAVLSVCPKQLPEIILSEHQTYLVSGLPLIFVSLRDVLCERACTWPGAESAHVH